MSEIGCVLEKSEESNKRISKYAELPFDIGIEQFFRKHLRRYTFYLGEKHNCIRKKCFWFVVSRDWLFRLPFLILCVFPETHEVRLISLKRFKNVAGGGVFMYLLECYEEKSGYSIDRTYRSLF